MLGYLHMEPQTIKTVGRRKIGNCDLSSATLSKEECRAWHKAFPTPFVPRGVYRFNSHEEADEWLWKMITRQKN